MKYYYILYSLVSILSRSIVLYINYINVSILLMYAQQYWSLFLNVVTTVLQVIWIWIILMLHPHLPISMLRTELYRNNISYRWLHTPTISWMAHMSCNLRDRSTCLDWKRKLTPPRNQVHHAEERRMETIVRGVIKLVAEKIKGRQFWMIINWVY